MGQYHDFFFFDNTPTYYAQCTHTQWVHTHCISAHTHNHQKDLFWWYCEILWHCYLQSNTFLWWCSDVLRHAAICRDFVYFTATHCNTLQHTATHCNALQHTATHCNTLQHTAIHGYTVAPTSKHATNPVRITYSSWVKNNTLHNDTQLGITHSTNHQQTPTLDTLYA